MDIKKQLKDLKTVIKQDKGSFAAWDEHTKDMEFLGDIEESRTGYAEIKNENGKTMYIATAHLPVEITQEMLDKVNNEGFDGQKRLGGIPWSWGPNDKFKRYLSSLGVLERDPNYR
jgi:hypothetical protein